MNLFLHSKPDEPLTKLLLEQLATRDNWESLHITSFSNKTNIRSAVANGSTGCILDRVFGFDSCKQPTDWESLFFTLRKSSPRHLSTLGSFEHGSWSIPLVNQWETISQSYLDVKVPVFHFPYQATVTFERPNGQQAVVLATPHDCWGSDHKKTRQIAMEICRDWRLWFAEILFFVDGDEITFGMLNLQPTLITHQPQSSAFVASQILQIEALL